MGGLFPLLWAPETARCSASAGNQATDTYLSAAAAADTMVADVPLTLLLLVALALASLLPVQLAGRHPGPQCGTFEDGVKLGTDALGRPVGNASTAAACCALCAAEPRCVVFSFVDKGDKKGRVCSLESKLGERKHKPGYTSGVVRSAPGPGPTPAPSPTPGPTPAA